MQLDGKQKSEKGNTDDKFMIYDIMIYDIMIYDIMIKMNYSNRTKLFDLKETFSAPFKSQISLVSLLGVKQSYSFVGKMYPL